MPQILPAIEATAIQLSRWKSLEAFYLHAVTRSCSLTRNLATLCASAQAVVGSAGFSLFNSADELKIKTTLDNYNTMGRLIAGVNLGKYLCSDTTSGDISVSTPSLTNAESSRRDIYLGLIWWAPAVAGIVLVVGIWAANKRLEYVANQQKMDLANRLNATDAQILASKNPAIFDTWTAWKKQNAGLIGEVTSQESGLIDKLLGGGSGKSIVFGLILIGGVWAILSATTRARR